MVEAKVAGLASAVSKPVFTAPNDRAAVARIARLMTLPGGDISKVANHVIGTSAQHQT